MKNPTDKLVDTFDGFDEHEETYARTLIDASYAKTKAAIRKTLSELRSRMTLVQLRRAKALSIALATESMPR